MLKSITNTAQLAPFNVPRGDLKALKELSARTRVSQAAYLREAVRDLLRKCQNQTTYR
jgi:hypothetical protein